MQSETMNLEDLIDPAPIPGEEVDGADHCMQVDELGQIPPDALRVLLATVIPRRKVGAMVNSRVWRVATVRLACLAHAIDLDGVGSLPLAHLADELGVCRATLSYASVNLREGIALPRRGGKSDAARIVYQERARQVWQRRKALEPKG
jgi:hypothetical protein